MREINKQMHVDSHTANLIPKNKCHLFTVTIEVWRIKIAIYENFGCFLVWYQRGKPTFTWLSAICFRTAFRKLKIVESNLSIINIQYSGLTAEVQKTSFCYIANQENSSKIRMIYKKVSEKNLIIDYETYVASGVPSILKPNFVIKIVMENTKTDF